jgi:hypothetical protein
MSSTIVGRLVKLKNHVYLGMVEDGILFDAGDASFVLRDKAVYPAVVRLITLLDAGHPVEAILEQAPAKLAEFFRKVLALLSGHGMLIEVGGDAPSAIDLASHTPENELRKSLEDKLGSIAVEKAMQRWHAAHVVVSGGGHALASAVRALAETGCGKLSVVMQEGSSQVIDVLRNEIDPAHAERLAVHAIASVDTVLDTCNLLLYAGDDVDMPMVLRVERVMRDRGIAGAIGVAFDGRACVPPESKPGRPGVVDLLHWAPAGGEEAASHGPVSMALLGCVSAQAAISRFFGVESQASSGQVAIVSPSLEVQYHSLVASAQGGGASVPFVYPSKYQMPEGRALLPFERVKFALDPWFDPLLGPFSVEADDRIEQVPLMQYPVRIRSASANGEDQVVVGSGLEHASAVIHGLSQAVEALAETFGPDNAIVVCAFDEDSWKRRALAHAVARSTEMAERHLWAWVDSRQLPVGPVRVLHQLLRFHVPDGIRMQMQWVDAGDAYILRVFDGETLLCAVIGADPLPTLEEALGKACSHFQQRRLTGLRVDPAVRFPSPRASAEVDDWRDALTASQAVLSRAAEFHLLASPGFPPDVYCGHAVLRGEDGP